MTDREKLLAFIGNMKEETRKAEIKDIQQELAKIRKAKAAAFKRMKAQEQTGDLELAKRSRGAYEYCEKYQRQLEHMLDGRRKKTSNIVFTKDAQRRYVKRRPVEV